MPYQNWRIKPEKDDSITVKILSAVLKMEFNIKNGLICLVSLINHLQDLGGDEMVNNNTNVLWDVLGRYLKLNRLKRYLKKSGIDIFPGW